MSITALWSDWEKLTDTQKISRLAEYCYRLGTTVNSLAQSAEMFESRIQSLEVKAEDKT